MTTQEEWRPIAEWPGYEISSFGRVRRMRPYRSTYVGRILKPYMNKGYYSMRVVANGVRKARTIHSLVAEAFIGPRPEGSIINHKDGDKTNNRPDNLEYTTWAGNTQHAYEHGLVMPPVAWRDDPEKVRRAQEKRLASMAPDAARGERNGAYTHPEKRPSGTRHGMAKHTAEQIEQVRELLRQGIGNRAIMKMTGVHESTVSSIKRGKNWKRI